MILQRRFRNFGTALAVDSQHAAITHYCRYIEAEGR